jgi:hypothetical protein
VCVVAIVTAVERSVGRKLFLTIYPHTAHSSGQSVAFDGHLELPSEWPGRSSVIGDEYPLLQLRSHK